MLNNALFRVEEVQDEKEQRRRKKENYDFKHTLASWSGLELARACAIRCSRTTQLNHLNKHTSNQHIIVKFNT